MASSSRALLTVRELDQEGAFGDRRTLGHGQVDDQLRDGGGECDAIPLQGPERERSFGVQAAREQDSSHDGESDPEPAHASDAS